MSKNFLDVRKLVELELVRGSVFSDALRDGLKVKFISNDSYVAWYEKNYNIQGWRPMGQQKGPQRGPDVGKASCCGSQNLALAASHAVNFQIMLHRF